MAGERLILTGFMCVGKTTGGKQAAQKLGVSFFDTDIRLREQGIEAADYLPDNPQPFREFEAQALQSILGERPAVIATGGGIVTTLVGRSALIKSDVPAIWLDAPFDLLAERAAADTGPVRPLFDVENLDRTRSIYYERRDWYAGTAEYTVDASQPLELVVDKIVEIAQSL